MNEMEVKNKINNEVDQISNKGSIDQKDMFWLESNQSQVFENSQNPEKRKPESMENQFVQKGANRKLDVSYDIHFQLGGGTFRNIMTFLCEIGYDVAFIFRKKEVILSVIDTGKTHIGVIKIPHIEFSDYTVKGLTEENNEKSIIIDISSIVEKLPIKDDIPIDVYIDNEEINRCYVINGDIKKEKQLGSEFEKLKSYVVFMDTMNRLLGNTKYQKVVVNSVPFMNVVKLLGMQMEKGKEVICDINLTRYQIDFIVAKDTESTSILLSGDKVVVYPLNDDIAQFKVEFINKLGKLKLDGMTSLYICGEKSGGSLPLIVEMKFGGGQILGRYLIAPYTEGRT